MVMVNKGDKIVKRERERERCTINYGKGEARRNEEKRMEESQRSQREREKADNRVSE